MIRLALHHLAVIRSLGSTRSVSATARQLGLTQSAISHRMKEAERRIGAKLFVRDGHVISLNPAGRRLLKSADTILSEVALAERDLERLSSGYSDTVRLGAACYAGFDWFPRLLASMRQKLPTVSVEIISEISEDPSSLISNNVADIVLTAAPVEQSNIMSLPLVDDHLVAVLPEDHPLCQFDYVEPEFFEQSVYVTHHTLPETGREYEKIFQPNGIMPKEVISAGRSQAVLELIEQKQGVTILPTLSVQTQASRMKLALRPVTKAGIPITWYALLKKRENEESMPVLVANLLKKSLIMSL